MWRDMYVSGDAAKRAFMHFFQNVYECLQPGSTTSFVKTSTNDFLTKDYNIQNIHELLPQLQLLESQLPDDILSFYAYVNNTKEILFLKIDDGWWNINITVSKSTYDYINAKKLSLTKITNTQSMFDDMKTTIINLKIFYRMTRPFSEEVEVPPPSS